MSKIKVTQVKSTIGRPPTQRRCLRALGLRRIGHSRVHDDNAVTRGAIAKVGHLVAVEEVNDAS